MRFSTPLLGLALLGASASAQADSPSPREVRRVATLQSVAAEKHFSPRMQSAVAKAVSLGESVMESPFLPERSRAVRGEYTYRESQADGTTLVAESRDASHNRVEHRIKLSPGQRVMTATTTHGDFRGDKTTKQREVRLPFGLKLRSSRSSTYSYDGPERDSGRHLELLVGGRSFTLARTAPSTRW